jgi:glycosyltransferase involved in cell wall biosynthesis
MIERARSVSLNCSLAWWQQRVFAVAPAPMVRVHLPHWARSRLRKGDVDVVLFIDAPGCDRTLEPTVIFDFRNGRQPVLRWRIDGVAARGDGVRLRLPRGLKVFDFVVHSGPFFARGLNCWIEPAFQQAHSGERVLFEAEPGDDGGLGALRSQFSAHTDAHISLTRNIDLAPNGLFSAQTPDPQINIDLAEPLETGWWRVEAQMAVASDARPRVYFDHDGDFFEHESIVLVPRGPARFVGYVRTGMPVDRLRFDPVCRLRETGNLQRLSLRPCSAPVHELLRPSVVRIVQTERRRRQVLHHLAGMPFEPGHWPMPLFPEEALESSARNDVGFHEWIEAFDYEPARDDTGYLDRLNALERRPLISVVMPVYKTPLGLLDKAIESVRGQIYTNWELCIADDASEDQVLTARLDYWQKTDPRIKFETRKTNGNISAATNTAFALVKGEWVALLDHDDELRPHALAEVVMTLIDHPDAELIYSDEDKIDEAGNRYGPYFKPDFSQFLLYGQNYFNHLTVHRSENIRDAGGWRLGYEGSQDFDLNLRIIEMVEPGQIVHIPKILYHWRAVAGSTAVDASEKSYAWDAGRRALHDHFERTGQAAVVGRTPGYPYYQVSWALPQPAPKVSLVIPTRDRAELVRLCVTSILEKTAYPDYEIIIVDNQSVEPESFMLFNELTEDPRVRVLRYDAEFNFSAINNYAVTRAHGEIVGLINNDVEVINPDWLWNMVALAAQEDVGCVGAMLYYPDDRIQHAGVVVGIGGVAGHSHKYLPRGAQGYFARLQLVHDVMAVTAACLVIRKSVYESVGGLNEADLRIAFNDVDFCLKVVEAGYRNIWTPRAELYHHESVSRGGEDSPEKKMRFQREVEYMLKRWRTDEVADPFYSPNLTLLYEDFRLKAPGEVVG